MIRCVTFVLGWLLCSTTILTGQDTADVLTWRELPSLPDKLGLAGPFVGVHNDALVVAGGANFPQPVWKNDKQWHDQIFVLVRKGGGGDPQYEWKSSGKLSRAIAYGAAVSTERGIVCIGGNDTTDTFADVFLLQVDADTHEVTHVDYPALPSPCAFGSATLVNHTIYVAGGQSGPTLDTAMTNFWSLDLSRRDQPSKFAWRRHDGVPWLSRALNITAGQHDGDHNSVYVISGRRQQGEQVKFLKDVWQYTPAMNSWRRRTDAPRCVMAGTGIAHGQSRLLVLGGADGSLFHRTDELRDQHPGFPKQALAYHTITDSWASAGAIPQNQVTTIAVKWNGDIIVPSGEIRPRVRSAKVWRVTVTSATKSLQR